MLHLRAILFAILALALLSAGCRSGSVEGMGLEVRPGKLAVVEDGVARALENGGSVTLAAGVMAEVFFSPYPLQRRTDLYLYLLPNGEESRTSKPGVEAEYSMMRMDHGTFTGTAVELQPGRYLLPLSFPMSGEWAVDIKVDWPEKTGHLKLVANVAQ